MRTVVVIPGFEQAESFFVLVRLPPVVEPWLVLGLGPRCLD